MQVLSCVTAILEVLKTDQCETRDHGCRRSFFGGLSFEAVDGGIESFDSDPHDRPTIIFIQTLQQRCFRVKFQGKKQRVKKVNQSSQTLLITKSQGCQ